MSDAAIGVFVPSALTVLGGVGKSQRAYRAIGPIVATVTVEEKHSDRLEITDHPVELGSTISDHAFRRPSEVTIRCSWSNSPAGSSGSLGGARDLLTAVLRGQVGNAVSRGAAAAIGGSGSQAVNTIIESAATASGVNAFAAAVNTGTGKGTSAVQDVYQQLLDLQASVVPFTLYTGKRVYRNMLISSISTETDVASENSLPVVLECREVIIVQTRVLAVTAPAQNQRDPGRTAPTADVGTRQVAPVDPTSNPRLVESLARSFPVH